MEVGSEVERVYFTLFRTYLFYFLKGVEFGEFGGKSETWPQCSTAVAFDPVWFRKKQCRPYQ